MKKIFILLAVLSVSLPVLAINLDEAIKTAQGQNPSISIARRKLEATQAQVAQARGAFFPTLKFEGSAGQVYSRPTETQFTTTVGTSSATQKSIMGVDATVPTSKMDLTFVQPIYTGNKIYAAFQIAQYTKDSSFQELRKNILAVNFDAISAYLGVLRAKEMLALSEQSYTMAQDQLSQVQARLRGGVAVRSDVLRSEVQLANAETSVTKAKNGVVIAKNILNNVLNTPLETEISVEAIPLEIDFSKLPTYEAILQTAFENRPEWLQFQLAKRGAQEGVTLARGDFFPAISALGTYGLSTAQYPTFTTNGNTWTAMLAASWNLFDLKIPAAVDTAVANFEAQQASEDYIRNNISLEIRNAYSDLKTARETTLSTKKALELAKENYKAARIRYAAGVMINLEVIDAEVSLTRARTDYLNAEFDLHIARAKLNKLVGKDIL